MIELRQEYPVSSHIVLTPKQWENVLAKDYSTVVGFDVTYPELAEKAKAWQADMAAGGEACVLAVAFYKGDAPSVRIPVVVSNDVNAEMAALAAMGHSPASIS